MRARRHVKRSHERVTEKERSQDFGAKAKVLLVDDHPVVRQALAELIDQESELSVCGKAEDAAAALQAIATARPDIAVVDLSLPQVSGLELIKEIRAHYSDVPVLVLSIHDESLYAERVLRAGARGYVMKEDASEKLLLAIRRVLSGRIYLSDRMAGRLRSKSVEGALDTGGSGP